MTKRINGQGTVTQLPSGSWRARYSTPDGKQRSRTLGSKTAALAFLAEIQTDLARNDWRPPEPGRESVADYVSRWVRTRPVKESTRSLYVDLHRMWIEPFLSDVRLTLLDPATVRAWHAEISTRTGPTRVSQAYRLLRAAMSTAVEDDVIKANPCRIRGAGQSAEAPTRAVTPGEVRALARAGPERYRALVLLFAWGGLRPGEAFALTSDDFDPTTSRITISKRTYRHHDGKTSIEAPKTRAGVRTVVVPAEVAAELVSHVTDWPGQWMFTTSGGRPMDSAQWHKIVTRACERADIPKLRPYDLRAAGATFAAQHGATTRELMARLGQVSPDAALRYQRAAEDRDRQLAEAMNQAILDGANVVPLRRRG